MFQEKRTKSIEVSIYLNFSTKENWNIFLSLVILNLKKNPALAEKNFIIKINLVKNWKEKLIYELKSYAIFVRVVILKEWGWKKEGNKLNYGN